MKPLIERKCRGCDVVFATRNTRREYHSETCRKHTWELEHPRVAKRKRPAVPPSGSVCLCGRPARVGDKCVLHDPARKDRLERKKLIAQIAAGSLEELRGFAGLCADLPEFGAECIVCGYPCAYRGDKCARCEPARLEYLSRATLIVRMAADIGQGELEFLYNMFGSFGYISNLIDHVERHIPADFEREGSGEWLDAKCDADDRAELHAKLNQPRQQEKEKNPCPAPYQPPCPPANASVPDAPSASATMPTASVPSPTISRTRRTGSLRSERSARPGQQPQKSAAPPDASADPAKAGEA
jgi:hypothetical protein